MTSMSTGTFVGTELEAELLLYSGEDVGKFGVGGVAWGVFWGKIQVEVVCALKPSSGRRSDVRWGLEYKGKRLYRLVPESDLAVPDHSVERRAFVWLKFRRPFAMTSA